MMGVQVEMWCHAPGMKMRVGLLVGNMVESLELY